MNLEQTNRGSLLHGISMNLKGKLVWTGTFESLQMFAEEVLNLSDGTWGSPGGDAKQYKSDNIDLRWYPETKSITISGKLKDEIKEKLISLSTISRQLANTESENEACVIGDLSVEKTEHSCVVVNHKLSLESLNSHLEAIAKEVHANKTAVNKILDEHTKGINQAKLQELENELARVRKENHKLSSENMKLKSEKEELMEKTNNLSYILADLQGKAKVAEEERDSVITAMRLLVAESNLIVKDNTDNELLNHNLNIEPGINEADDCTIQLDPNIQVSNRFSTLAVKENSSGKATTTTTEDTRPKQNNVSPEHGDGESIQGTKDSSSGTTELRNQVNDQGQTSTRDGDDSYKSKSVLIIGDSIIKHIDPRKLSKKSVYKRSFPGKRIEEIHDEIDNIHLNVEPSHVIIHAGTNNLPSEGADSCARKLQKLALKIRSKFQNSKIGISSLTHRDDINVIRKLSATYDKVKEMANKDDFVFIDNSYIDGSCLNGRKLHLNVKGSAYLANNFIKFIRPLGKQSNQQTDFGNPIHQLGQLLTQLARQTMNISPHKKPRR